MRRGTIRSLCNGCIFKKPCEDGKIGECPCRECLIKMVCVTVCDEAWVFFNKVHEILDK